MKLDRAGNTADNNASARQLQEVTGQVTQLQEDLQNAQTAKRILQQRLDEKEQKNTQAEMQLARLQAELEQHRREAQALDIVDSKIGDSLTIIRMASNEKDRGIEERFNKVI